MAQFSIYSYVTSCFTHDIIVHIYILLLCIMYSIQHVGKVYQSLSNSNHSKGVAIILTNNFPEYSMIDKQTDEEGRIVLLNIKLLFTNEVYTLINVYAPNEAQHRINFLKKINKFINQHAKSDKNIIICGDFNTCENHNDRASQKLDQSSEHFRHLKISNNFTDSYKLKNPNKNSYTYVHSIQPERNSRIDYILTSSNLVEFIKIAIYVQHQRQITRQYIQL